MVRILRSMPMAVAAVTLAFAAASCGERPQESSDAAAVPATVAPAATVVPATEPPVTPSPTAATEATEVAAATEVAISVGGTTAPGDLGDGDGGPLGGVSGLDPVPPQVDALTDPAVAETAVRYAYEHWLLLDLDAEVRGTLVEDGEPNVAAMAERLEEVRDIIEFGRIHVQSVAFGDAEHATVTFRINWYDDPSPIFPDEMTGAAVFQRGTWRIANRTLCVLAFGVQTDCSGSAPNPVPPEALRIEAVPDGLHWAGPAEVAGVVVPGQMTGFWADATDRQLQVWVEVLVGISQLAPADRDVLLALNRYGGPDSTPIELADVAGRVTVDGRSVSVVEIRGDDTVVRAYAEGLTVEEVVAAVASAVPVPAPDIVVGADGVPVATMVTDDTAPA